LGVQALGREIGHPVTAELAAELQQKHAAAYRRHREGLRPLRGARELLDQLSRAGVQYAIATSGHREVAEPSLKMLGVPPEIPVITREEVKRAKPDPDLFLAAAERLQVCMANAMVVGDSVWDPLAARRAGCLGVGVLSFVSLRQDGARLSSCTF
jgi:HAD superfamily hydrolase (TIGR01509 family)